MNWKRGLMWGAIIIVVLVVGRWAWAKYGKPSGGAGPVPASP